MNTVVEWFKRAEAKLDEKGRKAWIVVMVLGFIFVWPLGLAILFYMLWSGRMACGKRNWGRYHRSERYGETGNAAFDEYRAETLRRLEDERAAFVEFLDRLRRAKDKAEFDSFMADRGRKDDGPVAA